MRRVIAILLLAVACASAKPKPEEKCAPQTWDGTRWTADSCKQEK